MTNVQKTPLEIRPACEGATCCYFGILTLAWTYSSVHLSTDFIYVMGGPVYTLLELIKVPISPSTL